MARAINLAGQIMGSYRRAGVPDVHGILRQIDGTLTAVDNGSISSRFGISKAGRDWITKCELV
jgi:hypothetical protein